MKFMENILSFTSISFTEFLKEKFGKGSYHGNCIYRYFFKTGNTDFENLDCFVNIDLALAIKDSLILPDVEIADKRESDDVFKFALRLNDGELIESVILKMKNRHTLCVSSQVGCKMSCKFCATAKMGFKRNLTVDEITLQLYTAKFILGYDIRNIVFMGMGEPLDNYENVRKAILIFNDQHGFDMAFAHITLSTSGLADVVERLGKDNMIRPNLSVSLNSGDNKIRKELMPITKKFDLKYLKKVLLNYPLKRKGIIFITYTLFKGVNDSKEDAKKLFSYVRDLPCRINLIPYNAVEECGFIPCSDGDINRFAGYLETYDLFVRKRWTKGAELDAGCGQLAAKI